MARLVRGHQMPWPQQGGTEEPEINISVPQQEGQADAIGGKIIADCNPDVTMNQRNQTLKLKQLMKNRKTLMQDMQK